MHTVVGFLGLSKGKLQSVQLALNGHNESPIRDFYAHGHNAQCTYVCTQCVMLQCMHSRTCTHRKTHNFHKNAHTQREMSITFLLYFLAVQMITLQSHNHNT